MFLLLTRFNHMNTNTHLGGPAKNRKTVELFAHSCCAKTPTVLGSKKIQVYRYIAKIRCQTWRFQWDSSGVLNGNLSHASWIFFSGWWFQTCIFHFIHGIILHIDFHIFQRVETTNPIVSVITIGKLQIMHTSLIICTCGFNWWIWLALFTHDYPTITKYIDEFIPQWRIPQW